MRKFQLLILLALTACGAPMNAAPAVQEGTEQWVRVHATAAAQPWLAALYNCADEQRIILYFVNDPGEADINLRIGEPDQLTSPAYQVDQDNLLVVTHLQSPLQALDQTAVQKLFSHPDDQAVKLWIFAPGVDVQQAFERDVMRERLVSSLARVALSPQQMLEALKEDKNAVGILPEYLITGGLRKIFVLPNQPVLALVKSEPEGQIRTLLACLQK